MGETLLSPSRYMNIFGHFFLTLSSIPLVIWKKKNLKKIKWREQIVNYHDNRFFFFYPSWWTDLFSEARWYKTSVLATCRELFMPADLSVQKKFSTCLWINIGGNGRIAIFFFRYSSRKKKKKKFFLRDSSRRTWASTNRHSTHKKERKKEIIIIQNIHNETAREE